MNRACRHPVRRLVAWSGDWLRSAHAGLDPQAFFRGFAGRNEPFTVIFPGMGRVTFVADPPSCREILTIPREELCAPSPNPIEPIV